MDKSKRTDLLAAGRKKLLQFRQKKGGNKDGKSSGKGSKMEKDAEAEESEGSVKNQEPVKISEPDQTISADDGLPTSLEVPSVAAQHVDSQVTDSVPSGDESVTLDRVDANQGLIEPHIDEEVGAELPAEVEESRGSSLDERYIESTSAGTLLQENGNDEASLGVAPLSQYTDEKERAVFATSNAEPDKQVIKQADSAAETNEGETGPSLTEKAETNISKIDNDQEDLENAGNISSELEMPREAKVISIPLEAIQGFNADRNPDHIKVQAQITFAGISSHEQEQEGLSAYLDIIGHTTSPDNLEQNQEISLKSLVLEQKSEVPPPYDASMSRGSSLEEKLEIPSFVQVPPSLKEQEDSDNYGGRTEDEVVKGGVQLFREAMHERSRVMGEICEEGFLSHREMFERIKDCAADSSNLDSSSGIRFLNNTFSHEDNFYDGLEQIMRHLYVTSVVRDLQLQLDEHDEMNAHFSRQQHELIKLKTLVKEAQENNALGNEELAQCKSQLQSVNFAKKELEIQLQTKDEEIQELYDKSILLQNNLDFSQQELASLSSEVGICRVSVDTLQKQNLDLTANLNLETDIRRMFEGDKESLASENARLSSELLEQKDRLLVALGKQIQLECNLREEDSYIEQLIKENFYLSNSLDIHTIKIEELGNEPSILSFCSQKLELPVNNPNLEISLDGASAYSQCTTGSLAIISHLESYLLQNADGEDSDSSVILRFLKGCLEEVRNILHGLEKSIHSMHSQCQALSPSGRRTPKPGISKLIQAFESKTVLADNISQETQSTDGEHSDDSYASAKEEAGRLSDILEKMEFAITKLEAHILEENNNRILLNKMEVENRAQIQKNDILQASFDELADKLIDYRYRIDHVEHKFEEVCQFANDEAVKYLLQIELLQDKVKDIQSLAEQEKDSILDFTLESVTKLDNHTGFQIPSNIEISAHIVASVDAASDSLDVLHRKLDDANMSHETLQKSHDEVNELYTAAQRSNKLATDYIRRLYVMLGELLHESSVNIDDLSVDVKNEEFLQLLLQRCQMLVVHQQKLLDERNLLLSKNNELRSKWFGQNEKIENLNHRCNDLLEQLSSLHYAKDGLESVLRNHNECLEEVSRRCLGLAGILDHHQFKKDPDNVSGFTGGGELSMSSESTESYFIRSLIPRLEELVVHHIQKYEEIVKQVNLSKDYLLKINMLPNISAEKWSIPLPTLLKEEFVPKVCELKLHLDLLIASNIKHEAELQIYKDYSSRIMDALEFSHSKFLLKISELEQSEHRLSSVREKLSIAVGKGKGLVVQRDSLKQSLLEKSSALEKCSQELHSKEMLLKELEAKLKSYSEADRIESLESELSYIRNSATALRDSFLLKDSILQKIEEVLDGVDFLKQFSSKDVVEKIELLSRMVSGNSSSTVGDLGKMYSREDSHSDEGFVVMDDCREDLQAHSYSGTHELENMNVELGRNFYGVTEQKEILVQHSVDRDMIFDELKIEYQDLERRFYDLAEDKDMLEQSLVESVGRFNDLKNRYEDIERRYYNLAEDNEILVQSLAEANSLVKKWEEVLDSIHMTPHSRSLDPLDKIEWLRHTVHEAQQEKNSLQLKIVNLETSADTLSLELEESHKKKSELSAELVVVKSEKDFISESLEKVKLENVRLSESVMQDEDLRDALQNELAKLQKKMAEKVQEVCDIENEIWQLFNSVISTLRDNFKPELLSEGSAFNCLETLVSKLVQEYSTLIAEKAVPKDVQEVQISEGKKVSSDMTTSTDASDVREQELYNVRLALSEAISSMDLLKVEKNELKEKCNTLMLEIEELRQQELLLQGERNFEKEKNQILVTEMEVLQKEKHVLQEQLTQEEQKSASVREKLNVAVRKGKGLVQQRDSLKQTIEEMNIMVENLKSENSQRIEALESEKKLLVNKLTETEHNLELSRHNLNSLLAVINGIDVEAENDDPVQKLEGLEKMNRNLRSAVASFQQETEKSKRVADLLLTELNEVQERAEILQEELRRAESTCLIYSKQKDSAEAAKNDALHRLEQTSLLHSEESKNYVEILNKLKLGVQQTREAYIEIHNGFVNAFTRQVDLFCSMDNFMESISKHVGSNASSDLPSSTAPKEVEFHVIHAPSEDDMHEQADGLSISQQFDFSVHNVLKCARDYDELKRNIQRYTVSVDQRSSHLLKMMDSLERKFTSEREEHEALRRDISGLELLIREKENENAVTRKSLSLLYQACCTSISEIEDGNSQKAKDDLASEKHNFQKGTLDSKSWNLIDWKEPLDATTFLFPEEHVRSLSDKLLSTVKGAKVNALEESNLNELKSTLMELRNELQEKDFQMNRICQELVSQIRDAEAVTKKYSLDLDSAKATIQDLEKQIEVIKNDNKLLKSRVNELEDLKASESESQEKLKSLMDDVMATKDQEIEALMQALDEEETQFVELESKNKELENLLQEKVLTMKNLEASRAKALAKLSTTMCKFDELRVLSESLLSEVENLQSQLQVQDSEISFLRQEATRCTSDLLSSQEAVKKYSSELHDVLKWLEMMISLFGLTQNPSYGDESGQIRAYTDILGKRLATLVAESDNLRLIVQSKDGLLQAERSRVEELLRKYEALETSLREKENQSNIHHEGRSSDQTSRDFSGALENKQLKNKPISSAIVTHVRSGRRVNGDQIAIAIDSEKDDNMLDDEDDDKAHGFRALIQSSFIPRFSRPIADRIDGIWVSGDRLLMRQPTLRLGIVLYWIALHALLAGLI